MLPLHLGSDRRHLRVLCIGAHSDDIEIGCGGALLELMDRYPELEVVWAILSATGEREREARRSAAALLRRAAQRDVLIGGFRDAHFPAQFAEIKAWFGELAALPVPDLILTHRREDRHQDHGLVAELTWQTFRDHLVLEYEIPKYEGDLGQPQMFVPLSPAVARRKVTHLMKHFGSQRSHHWFNEDAFYSLMRLRGLECRAASGFAEAFHLRKAIL